MKTAEPRAIELKDYAAPAYCIPEIALDFRLEPNSTRVTAKMQVQRRAPNPQPLVLNGKRLKLISAAINGKVLEPSAYEVTPEALTIASPPEKFALELVTEIAPAGNTALEGLYMSNGIYCTQCEPEGFRCITYYLDRPDNLAKFETRIVAPKSTAPVLLSNAHPISPGDLAGGRQFGVGGDPVPNPGYRFALVSCDVGRIVDA